MFSSIKVLQRLGRKRPPYCCGSLRKHAPCLAARKLGVCDCCKDSAQALRYCRGFFETRAHLCDRMLGPCGCCTDSFASDLPIARLFLRKTLSQSLPPERLSTASPAAPAGGGDGFIPSFLEVILPSPQVASNLSESYLPQSCRSQARRLCLRVGIGL